MQKLYESVKPEPNSANVLSCNYHLSGVCSPGNLMIENEIADPFQQQIGLCSYVLFQFHLKLFKISKMMQK